MRGDRIRPRLCRNDSREEEEVRRARLGANSYTFLGPFPEPWFCSAGFGNKVEAGGRSRTWERIGAMRTPTPSLE